MAEAQHASRGLVGLTSFVRWSQLAQLSEFVSLSTEVDRVQTTKAARKGYKVSEKELCFIFKVAKNV